MQASFALTEEFAFGSTYSWRLKESEIRFRGAGRYERLVLRRISASEQQIVSFLDALDLLQVWDWRNDYRPIDVGFEVLDGSAWTFTANIGARNCRASGWNAYPSFADATTTSLERGRFGLLHAALYDCFAIEAYIYQAKRFAEQEAQQRGKRDFDE